jgi:hypothetical protein
LLASVRQAPSLWLYKFHYLKFALTFHAHQSDSSVSIVTRLRAGRPEKRGSIQYPSSAFSPRRFFQTRCGSQPAFCPVCTDGLKHSMYAAVEITCPWFMRLRLHLSAHTRYS